VTRPLLTISEFARAVELAPSALRYYREAGLLPPTEVDPQIDADGHPGGVGDAGDGLPDRRGYAVGVLFVEQLNDVAVERAPAVVAGLDDPFHVSPAGAGGRHVWR